MQKYIITAAQTNSDWDSVNFGLIELDTETLSNLKRYINKMKELKEEGIDGITVHADNVGFFDEYDNKAIPELEEGKYEIIELSDECINSFKLPEQTVKYGTMRVTEYNIIFVSYGKHTDEEFWLTINNDYILSL